MTLDTKFNTLRDFVRQKPEDRERFPVFATKDESLEKGAYTVLALDKCPGGSMQVEMVYSQEVRVISLAFHFDDKYLGCADHELLDK